MTTDQQKIKRMIEHRNKIKDCHRCDLRKVYDKPVPCIGNPDADVMFVGEAPGADEVLLGKPFVGPSGKMLRSAIVDGGLDPDDVFITNVLCCRPTDNKFPSDEALVKICLGHIGKEMEIVRPKIVVAVGGKAHLFLRGEAGGTITRVCGDWVDWETDDHGTIRYMATLHPSFCMKGGIEGHANPVMAMSSKERVALLRQHVASIAQELEALR